MTFEFECVQSENIPDMYKLNISKHSDLRGDLWTVWDREFETLPSLDFNLDKVSISKYNVLRGMHGDKKSWKYISVLHGQVFFAVADLRVTKPSIKVETMILNSQSPQSVLIPPNVVNGYYVLSECAVCFYKWCFDGEYPDVKDQITIKWNDPKLAINWPCDRPILQERDK